jgi:acetylornithine deacetylase/succinyl-diaminopimelate desuccinylase-like protein
LLAAFDDPTEDYESRYGVPYFIKGLTGGTKLKAEEISLPTCTICGLTSGYQGPGSKTVLPARASAKVDFRLTPDQEPADILKKLRAHLDSQGFIDVQITVLGGDAPPRTDPDHPFIQLVARTTEEVYEMPQ